MPIIKCAGCGHETNIDPQLLAKGSSHYKGFAIEPIEFIMANDLSFVVGNIIKYVCRYKAAKGVEDLEKAKHYLELLISEIQKNDNNL
jgi:hypothetical protein